MTQPRRGKRRGGGEQRSEPALAPAEGEGETEKGEEGDEHKEAEVKGEVDIEWPL